MTYNYLNKTFFKVEYWQRDILKSIRFILSVKYEIKIAIQLWRNFCRVPHGTKKMGKLTGTINLFHSNYSYYFFRTLLQMSIIYRYEQKKLTKKQNRLVRE